MFKEDRDRYWNGKHVIMWDIIICCIASVSSSNVHIKESSLLDYNILYIISYFFSNFFLFLAVHAVIFVVFVI